MGPDEFKTISNIGKGTYSDKKSKFLAFSHHVETESEIKKLLSSYKKKYYDARHICYAYVLGFGRDLFRANDDGEPSSTAGKPILGQIKSNGLTDIIIVVVRYYGGINLGTGGLITAYKNAAAAAIEASDIVTKQVEDLISFSFPYEQMNSVMRIIKELKAKVISHDGYGNICTVKLGIRKSDASNLKNKLESLRF